MPSSTLKVRNSKKIGAKVKTVTVRAKKMPQLGQPGFDWSKVVAEERRFAATLPLGTIFRSPVTGRLLIHTGPITSEEVYARFY